MKFFKKVFLIGFVMMLAVPILYFLKPQVYKTVEDHYKPTIALNEVVDLSSTEIVEKLFIRYLEHYKDKPIFDEQRIKDYKIIAVSEVTYETDGIMFEVLYSIRQHFWNEYWEIGVHKEDGMAKTHIYVSLIKEKDQFRLKLMGGLPPTPKK